MFGKMFEWANLTRVLGILGITHGGTGAATAAGARTNLDVYSKSETDSLVSGLLDLRGSFDASGGGYPTTGGSGTAGAILKGDSWKISVAGVIGQLNDVVYALVDTPAQTAGNWGVIEGNLSETSFGIFSNSLTAKTTPVDADSVNVVDSADSNKSKKLSWANIKAALKSYFDGFYLSLAGGTLSGNLTLSGASINEAAAVNLATDASGTTDIGAVASNNINLTGSNPITSFGVAAAGVIKKCRILGSGGSLITYNQSSLITAHAKNIITRPNDSFEIISLGSGNWFMLNYKTGNGRDLPSTILDLIDASTVSPDLSLGDSFRLITTSAVGSTRKLGALTNPIQGTKDISLIVRQDSAGSRAMTWDWCYLFPQGVQAILSTARRAFDFFKLEVVKYVPPATATVTIANPAVVTQTAHGHVAGSVIAFTETTGALPTGLALNTAYWVDYVDANSYRLFASQADSDANGPNITTTGSQSGVHKVTGLEIVVGMNAKIGR